MQEKRQEFRFKNDGNFAGFGVNAGDTVVLLLLSDTTMLEEQNVTIQQDGDHLTIRINVEDQQLLTIVHGIYTALLAVGVSTLSM